MKKNLNEREFVNEIKRRIFAKNKRSLVTTPNPNPDRERERGDQGYQ